MVVSLDEVLIACIGFCHCKTSSSLASLNPEWPLPASMVLY